MKTDIARFYSSVYTHSIPWALKGKNWVKQNHWTPAFTQSYANLLDKAVAAGQSGQTIGIPIGPDTSRILAELIVTELEELIRHEIPELDARAVRYVDDIIVGIESGETADAILSKLSAGLYEYELELNGEKTAVHGLGVPHSPEWIHFIRSFKVSPHPARQREDLDSFFEHSLYLAEANPRENVLLFAVKRAAGFPIAQINSDHLIRWLLYATKRSSACLSFLVEQTVVMRTMGVELPLDEIKEFILDQMVQHAEAAHTGEVAWLLFWARELEIKVPASALLRVTRLASSATALVTLDLLRLRRIQGTIDVSYWQSFASTGGLKSEMWLVSYEATKKGWWTGVVSNTYITSHEFFSDLWGRHVEFYAPNRKARPSFRRPSFVQRIKSTVPVDSEFDGIYP